MQKYPSIETVFTRDHSTNLLNFGDIRQPEVALINRWSISEKIDGTNIRVTVTLDDMVVKGRTDKAELPKGLEDAVRASFPEHAALLDYFAGGKPDGTLSDDWNVTFYGEGYGAGIQKAGKEYSATKRFRCFDLLYGGKHWAADYTMREVCADLGIPTAPWLGVLTFIPDRREELTRAFPESRVAREERDAFFEGEGIVAKPERVLLDARGDRVMWKLCYREFR